MNNNIRKAKVKGSDRIVEVYKLKEGSPTKEHIWHIYLGDNISIGAIESGAHNETFTSQQLEFLS